MRRGIVDHPGERKLHSVPVPRVGGIAIAVSYVATLLLLFVMPSPVVHRVPEGLQLSGLVIAAGIVFFTGLADDLIGLTPAQKLLGQLLGSATAFCSGIQIHVVKEHPLELWMSLPLTLLWLIACSNAFNLIDGMDGLAAGVGFFATITILIAALTHGNLTLAMVTIPLAGCLFGFLRYNFNPASVFLGDCGSLLIGFLLGCYGVMWGQKSATLLGMTAPIMSMAIPLLDAGLAIVRRYMRNRPIFGADRGHIHHRLLDRGLTVRGAALVLYAVCGVAALLSLLQNSAQSGFGSIVIVLFALAAWIGINHLGYTEFAVARDLLFGGELWRLIDARTRLTHVEQELAQAETLTACWQLLRKRIREFGFSGIRLSVQGRVFEDLELPTGATWQMRIPLPDRQYVNLYCALDSEVTRSATAFARALESVLQQKLTEPEFVTCGTLQLELDPATERSGASAASAA